MVSLIMEIYQDKAVNGVLAEAQLALCLFSLHPLPVVIFQLPECNIGIDILGSWNKPHIGYLAFGEHQVENLKNDFKEVNQK